MSKMNQESDMPFLEAVRGLLAGDFSRLSPLFETLSDGSSCRIARWFDDGLFVAEPQALAEAFTCACFNGCTQLAEYLLTKGVDPSGGIHTGLNAFHWAANRGQLKTVELLIRKGAPLETLNAHGGTVLGITVWSAIHEPKPDHLQIIEALLKAGANVSAANYPSGDERIDELLRRYGAAA
jgi:Ankyrin repeats (3 copies)